MINLLTYQISNYEIFPHKILKSRLFKKSSILIVITKVLLQDWFKTWPALQTISHSSAQKRKVWHQLLSERTRWTLVKIVRSAQQTQSMGCPNPKTPPIPSFVGRRLYFLPIRSHTFTCCTTCILHPFGSQQTAL